jgi:hypothetical protein
VDDNVTTANALAAALRQATLPRLFYRKEETAQGNKQTSILRVSLPREKLIQSTPNLDPSVYELYGLRASQKLQLEPGDRLLLWTQARDRSFDLVLPAHAYLKADTLGFPRATAEAGPKSGVHLTIPQLEIPVGNNVSCSLNFTATLEPRGTQGDGPVLKQTRPLFAWFDVRHGEGKPLPDLSPRVRIVNKPGLIAPAWAISVDRWDRNQATARLPQVTALWVEAKPGNSARFPLPHLENLDEQFEKMPKTATLDGESIKLVGLTLEEIQNHVSLPEGKYLTVRVQYGTPGKPVFLRPGSLKGTRQAYLLSEQHLYYDSQARYTARFGPLMPAELADALTLELYSVAEIRKAAEQSGRAVTIRVPNEESNRNFNRLSALKQDPAGR